MDLLIKKLCSLNSSDEMENALSDQATIKEGSAILDELMLSHTASTKDFLCVFPIYKFPKSLLGDLDVGVNNEIFEHAKNIIETPFEKTDKIKTSIVNFLYHFKKWKSDDNNILIYHLFEEYHQLSVDILNTNDFEKQHVFKKCQTELLEIAKRVGGKELVSEIQNYKAVVASNINFQKEYDKAYWESLKESYDKHDYSKCVEIIMFIKNILVSIGSNTSTMEDSTNTIIDQLENSNSNFLNIKEWSLELFDYIKTIHSPVHDMQLESFKRDIHIKEIYLPTVVKNIFCLVKNIIHDFDEIKRKMNQM